MSQMSQNDTRHSSMNIFWHVILVHSYVERKGSTKQKGNKYHVSGDNLNQ